MTLLLAFLMGAVALGLLTDRMTRQVQLGLLGLVVLTLLLYYFTHRFMS
ncbi:MAG TPA: hypothetical protein VFA70_05675 [Dehalococcoidia bacterium]|nr:hypothetical protein [Dehalococcoidia bacterium]